MTQQVRRGYRNHKKGTWAAVLVVLVAVALAIVLPASGAADKKTVDGSTIAPAGSWSRGSTVSNASVSIKNGSGSQQLGSADLCVPNGFTGVTNAVAIPAGSPCAAYSNSHSSVVRLRNLAIAPGETRVVALGSISVSCTASSPATWKLHAKQSNDFSGLPGNDFTPYPKDLAVTITGACTLEFVTQPADVEVGDSLVAKSGGPAIQVRALAGGSPVGGVQVTVMSSSPTLTGGDAIPTASGTGVASFSSLTPGPVGGPYELTASAPGFTSATSDEFFVLDLVCEPGQPCSVTKSLDSQTSVTASQTGFVVPVGLLVDGTADAASGLCGVGPGGLSEVGSNFRIEVRPLDGYTEITWRYTKSERLKKPSNGQTYELCVGTKLVAQVSGVNAAFPVLGGGVAVEDTNDPGRYWGILTDAPSSAKCDSSYPLTYPAKIAEYSNGADAIQVACFPYPFDPKGIGVG